MKKKKIGRNDLCHCKSGNKYKRCCLEADKKKDGIPYVRSTGRSKNILFVKRREPIFEN